MLENQLHHYGAANDKVRQPVQRKFSELFMPSDAAWLAKAHADAWQAVTGILRAEGFG
jgi:hypothetical protein